MALLESLESRQLLTTTFSAELPIVVPDQVYGKFVVAADLDDDNDQDLVVAWYGSNNVSWYENDGTGDFSKSHLISSLAIRPTSVHVTDVDGDGDLDVLSVSAGTYDQDVSWYANTDGKGTFGPQQVITADIDQPDSVFAADLDGDGDQDVLSASRDDNTVAWYPNEDSAGAFGEKRILADSAEGATSVYADDFDGDGDLDVISGSLTDGEVLFFRNTDAAGNFEQTVVSESTPGVTAVLGADVDGDGDLDILAASRGDDTVSWFPNEDGMGTFGEERIISVDQSAPNELYVADINKDGILDVLAAGRDDDSVAWIPGLGGGLFDAPVIVSDNADNVASIVAGDWDLDGDLDIASVSRGDNKLASYENLGDGTTFGPQQVWTEIGVPSASYVYSADIDGDGDPDVLSASFAEDAIMWSENRGDGEFGPPRLISNRANGAEAVVGGDIDGDGDLDVVSASYFDNKIAWYENRDGKGDFGPQRVITVDSLSPEDLRVGDLDGDMDLDVIVASRYDNKIAWYENLDGKGHFGQQRTISDAQQSEPTVVRVADLDGDGDLDVLANGYDPYDSSIAWYPNTDGKGNFGPRRDITVAVEFATGVEAADIDLDGDLDVVSISGGNNRVAWYQNLDGKGDFGEQLLIDDDASTVFWSSLADLDNDGDVDLVVAMIASDLVAWYENLDGLGSFSERQIISDTVDQQPTSVHVADLDGDGRLDVLASLGDLADRTVWYRNEGSAVNPDFNQDGEVDDADIDLLCAEIMAGGLNPAFDLNSDGSVNAGDHFELVTNVLQTSAGDSNLDGVFNSSDFIFVFLRGEYEDGIELNSGWADGDWNCDGDFTSTDLVVAFLAGGYSDAAIGLSSVLPAAEDVGDAADRTEQHHIRKDSLDDTADDRTLRQRRLLRLAARPQHDDAIDERRGRSRTAWFEQRQHRSDAVDLVLAGWPSDR